MNLSTSKLMAIVPKSLVRNVSRQVLVAKKNSPHIFFVGGVIGTVASTVLACRATLKLSATLDEIKEDVDTVKEMHDAIDADEMVVLEEGQVVKKTVYSTEEWYKDTIYVYGKSGFKIVKLYAPAIVVGAISISALTGSHIQLTRRNTALMASFALLQQAFEEYRERVRFAYGDERELDLYHGMKTQVEKNADGDKIETKYLDDPNKRSMYARFFDEGSSYWVKNPEMNRMFVQCQQNYANNLLQARGHVFLNEVYDMLGIDRSTPGQVVGWVLNGDGDNYVSFDMFNPDNARFVNGVERSILLDFNVDGVVYDKI
jgi:Family of unknown function (DUF6353)